MSEIKTPHHKDVPAAALRMTGDAYAFAFGDRDDSRTAITMTARSGLPDKAKYPTY